MVTNVSEGTPMMEAADSSEILKVNQTTQRHILEEYNVHGYRRYNFWLHVPHVVYSHTGRSRMQS
jgi:hypothetical protein